jgi:hypothetical protein
VTVVPLLALQLASVVERSKRDWKQIAFFFGFIGIGFLFAAPYGWTDPIRFAKSVLGNLAREGEPMGCFNTVLRMANVASPYLAILGVLGVWSLLRTRQWVVLVGALFTIAGVAWLTARAGVVYDHYYLVGILTIAILGAFGFEWVYGRVAALQFLKSKRAAAILICALGITICTADSVNYFHLLSKARSSGHDLQRLVDKLSALGDEYTVIVPKDGSMMFERLAFRVSSKSAELIAAGIPRTPENVVRFAVKGGLPENVAYALEGTLNNQEQILAAHLYVMAYPRDRMGMTIVIYDSGEVERARFGLIDPAEAVATFDREHLAALVLPRGSAGPSGVRSSPVGEYDLYMKKL